MCLPPGAHSDDATTPFNGGVYTLRPDARIAGRVAASAPRWPADFRRRLLPYSALQQQQGVPGFLYADSDQGFLFHLFRKVLKRGCYLDSTEWNSAWDTGRARLRHFVGGTKCDLSGRCHLGGREQRAESPWPRWAAAVQRGLRAGISGCGALELPNMTQLGAGCPTGCNPCAAHRTTVKRQCFWRPPAEALSADAMLARLLPTRPRV
eukprot:TRINITY_DN21733_c0_g1_i2.p1 TRINITY_DN21733_c0_g1~~TRINITY_DN21733_c0_g1_i2.p1  ORF type:complete len:208 (+),score=41.42 TRINITY_DN21733_c0_g1_i2:554-1177(+)